MMKSDRLALIVAIGLAIMAVLAGMMIVQIMVWLARIV